MFGKVHQICSDQGLFILILAIVSVKIILIIFWTCLDIRLLVDRNIQNIPPYFLVTLKCTPQSGLRYSTHTQWSQYLLWSYQHFLHIKIKRHDFKDTKKINILVGALVFDLCVCLPLWAILRLIDYATLSRVAYSVGIILAAFLCQVFLILPKIVPLVLNGCRSLKTWKVTCLRHICTSL